MRRLGAEESRPHPSVNTGSGFSGLGMGIALQKQGVDFVILEKADEIGGIWRDNTYPGCACDIPSHMYSFSFEPKPDWTHLWSLQPEILDYLKGVTAKYGLRRYVRFNSHVERAHWDDAEMRWHVFTDGGQEYIAQFLISGAGALHIPLVPDIEGRDEFAGAAFHSAQWDHSVDITGKRVAVADMPNLFLLLGPNTGLGHNSVVFMIESQSRYVAQAIAAVDKARAQTVAPTRRAQADFNGELQHDLAKTVWNTGGCRSWYMDSHGVNRVLWGGMTWQYWLATRRFTADEYEFSGRRGYRRYDTPTQLVVLQRVVIPQL